MIQLIAVSVTLAMNYFINQKPMYARYLIAVISLIVIYAPARALISVLIALRLTIWLIMDKIAIKSFAKILNTMIRVFRLVSVHLGRFYQIASVLVVL